MKRHFYFLFLFLVLGGCGYKYPLPPESPGSLPNEEDYIKVENTSWDRVTFGGIKDIMVGKDGYIYVLESHDLLRFTINGDLVDTFYVNFTDARSVAQDIARNLYVTDSGTVYIFTRDGALIRTLTFSDGFDPIGVDVSAQRIIYLSDSIKHLVIGVDTLGNVVDTVATEGTGILSVRTPVGLSVSDKFNGIAIASKGNNWVECLTLSKPRVSLIHLGGLTHEGGDTAGVFNLPTDVWVDTFLNVYVLDFGNGRIQKFDSTGRFIHMEEFSSQPVSMATTKDGVNLYVAFVDRVIKMKKPEIPQNPGGAK